MSHFDKISINYAINNDKCNHEIYAKLASFINPKIIKQNVLDIGNGGYFPYNIDDAESVTAIDISTEMLDQIIHPGIIKVIGDARTLLNINDESYDVVMLCFCIHHVNGNDVNSAINSLNQIITTAHSKLKKGGRLIITECIVNNYLYFCQRVLYEVVKFFLKACGKDMIFFHNNQNVLNAMCRAFVISPYEIDQVEIKLEQAIDPLVGTFPGIIKIPAWMNFTQFVFYEVVKKR
jgi:ubiquinone/menaquinone biosynthesis C-methylase UbiE